MWGARIPPPALPWALAGPVAHVLLCAASVSWLALTTSRRISSSHSSAPGSPVAWEVETRKLRAQASRPRAQAQLREDQNPGKAAGAPGTAVPASSTHREQVCPGASWGSCQARKAPSWPVFGLAKLQPGCSTPRTLRSPQCPPPSGQRTSPSPALVPSHGQGKPTPEAPPSCPCSPFSCAPMRTFSGQPWP